VAGVQKFLSQIFTKPHIKEYVLLLLSSFLNGGIKEERFHIWTGTGANGKSKLIELFEMAFGEYCCKFPITLLTQKRAASNAATSELARAKGKRFACLQEPGEDEKLNIGLMKELTGGDKIMARLIYKEPIEFKPQFKMILTCNHLPNVPSDDGGTWRRLRVVEFTSKFTDTPNPENENEFPIDMEISKHFEDWKECFMSLLIEYYKKYMTSGIAEPDEVLKCTKEYQKNNDVMLEFIESEFERNDQGFVTISDVLALFKSWVKDSLPNFKIGKKKDLIMGMSKTFGKHVTVNRVDGWKGWRFKQMMGDGDDYLD
jgi:P4 family phage/plasmid primase-like protien